MIFELYGLLIGSGVGGVVAHRYWPDIKQRTHDWWKDRRVKRLPTPSLTKSIGRWYRQSELKSLLTKDPPIGAQSNNSAVTLMKEIQSEIDFKSKRVKSKLVFHGKEHDDVKETYANYCRNLQITADKIEKAKQKAMNERNQMMVQSHNQSGGITAGTVTISYGGGGGGGAGGSISVMGGAGGSGVCGVIHDKRISGRGGISITKK